MSTGNKANRRRFRLGRKRWVYLFCVLLPCTYIISERKAFGYLVHVHSSRPLDKTQPAIYFGHLTDCSGSSGGQLGMYVRRTTKIFFKLFLVQCFPATLYHFQRHPICLFDISARSIWFAISTIVIRPAWLKYHLAQFFVYQNNSPLENSC